MSAKDSVLFTRRRSRSSVGSAVTSRTSSAQASAAYGQCPSRSWIARGRAQPPRTRLEERIARFGSRSHDQPVLAATLDPDGRRVELTENRWRHIRSEHTEMARHLGEIMRAVREPDRRRSGRASHEEWFFLERAGPSRWLQVVVHYERDEGWIITAFPRRSLPR